jgi:hypothetical protein
LRIADILVAVQGEGAVEVTQELLSIPEVTATWKTEERQSGKERWQFIELI